MVWIACWHRPANSLTFEHSVADDACARCAQDVIFSSIKCEFGAFADLLSPLPIKIESPAACIYSPAGLSQPLLRLLPQRPLQGNPNEPGETVPYSGPFTCLVKPVHLTGPPDCSMRPAVGRPRDVVDLPDLPGQGDHVRGVPDELH